jgi:hypothetical protein
MTVLSRAIEQQTNVMRVKRHKGFELRGSLVLLGIWPYSDCLILQKLLPRSSGCTAGGVHASSSARIVEGFLASELGACVIEKPGHEAVE